MNHIKRPLNIIYLNTSERGASGGAKIIYRHSDLINKLNISNVTSEVLHIKKSKISKWTTSVKKKLKIKSNKHIGWDVKDITVNKNYKHKWFDHDVKIKKNFIFDKKKDFIIFPEIHSHFAKKLCINKKIPYAIFALNGYTLETTSDYQTLWDSYKGAKFILTISNHISDCVKLAFPICKNKIFNSRVSIDSKKLSLKVKKTNTITYMPRKLPQHSELVLFFLKKLLPKNWKIKKIQNFTEEEVFYYLLRSKIFLSFTHFEGLGMPPIEAAIAGNKVIGYTGEAGKEIWNKPIFTEIPNGDILKFVDSILKNLKIKNNTQKNSLQRKKLKERHSIKNERKNIINLIRKIQSYRD